MATPHVAGALALAISLGKTLKGDDVGLSPEEQGSIGRVNAKRSVLE